MEKDKLGSKKIAVIGIGHMGKALMRGLLNVGYKKSNLLLSNDSSQNRSVATKADWLLLCVKPLVVGQVITDIKDKLQDKLLISVAAATTISSINNVIGDKKQKIARIMPNIAVSCNRGVIGLYSQNISLEEKNELISVLSTLGQVLEVKKEKDLDILTVLSSCGPAIVAYFLQLVSDYGLKGGLSKKLTNKLVSQTFQSTLSYLLEHKMTSSELITSVATPGGVTESIINALNNNDFNKLFEKAMDNGYTKIIKLIEQTKFKK